MAQTALQKIKLDAYQNLLLYADIKGESTSPQNGVIKVQEINMQDLQSANIDPESDESPDEPQISEHAEALISDIGDSIGIKRGKKELDDFIEDKKEAEELRRMEEERRKEKGKKKKKNKKNKKKRQEKENPEIFGVEEKVREVKVESPKVVEIQPDDDEIEEPKVVEIKPDEDKEPKVIEIEHPKVVEIKPDEQETEEPKPSDDSNPDFEGSKLPSVQVSYELSDVEDGEKFKITHLHQPAEKSILQINEAKKQVSFKLSDNETTDFSTFNRVSWNKSSHMKEMEKHVKQIEEAENSKPDDEEEEDSTKSKKKNKPNKKLSKKQRKRMKKIEKQRQASLKQHLKDNEVNGDLEDVMQENNVQEEDIEEEVQEIKKEKELFEDSSDEAETPQKKEKKVAIEERFDQLKNSKIIRQAAEQLLDIPSNASQLERDLRSLKDQPDLQRSYLLKITPEIVSALFK